MADPENARTKMLQDEHRASSSGQNVRHIGRRASVGSRRQPRMVCGHNRNVVVGFIFTISNYAAQSVWGNTILAAFIYVATDKDKFKVGVAEGLMGLGTVGVGLLSGYFSDKGGRTKMIVLGGIFNILAIAATAVAVLFDWNRYPMILVSCTLWGVYGGVTTASVEAIFGDSVASGKRQGAYLWRDGLGTGARAAGPLIGVIIFIALGVNDWRLSDLQIVMMAGLALALVPCTCCFCFSDSDTLGKESEAFNARGKGEDEVFRTVYDPKQGAATRPDTSNGLTQYIPLVQFLSSLAMGIASGITSKYFPIFFIEDIHLGPIVVNSVYAVMPLTTSACSYCVMMASYKIGRVQAVLMCLAIAIPLLFFMAAMPVSFWHSEPVLIIAVQVVRTSFIQAFSPVSRSILNDYAPKDQRARWNSLSSIQKVGWSGSAMIGGWIVNNWGFSVCFWATAGIQLIGFCIRLFLLKIVPRDPPKESKGTAAGWHYAMSKESFLEDPELNALGSQQVDETAQEQKRHPQDRRGSSDFRRDTEPQQSYWSSDNDMWDSVNSYFSNHTDDPMFDPLEEEDEYHPQDEYMD